MRRKKKPRAGIIVEGLLEMFLDEFAEAFRGLLVSFCGRNSTPIAVGADVADDGG